MDKESLILWSGIVLCGLVAFQLFATLIRSVVRGYLEWKIYRARWLHALQELSPQPHPASGDPDAGRTASERGPWPGWRKFRVEQKIQESGDCVSIVLVPHDGKPLPTFLPGQFVTLSVRVPGETKPLVRCYSLSDRPLGRSYRLTVKRVLSPDDVPHVPKGKMSNFIHDRLQVGDLVDVRSPQGTFCVDPQVGRSIALVAGGVGITPMISILNELHERQWDRPLYLFYVVRYATEYPFREYLRDLARRWPTLRLFVFCTQPDPELRVGVDYSRHGRIKASHLLRVVPLPDVEYYICGPAGMMTDLSHGLLALGVSQDRIHMEAFGPPVRTSNLVHAGAGIGGGEGEGLAGHSPPMTATVRFAHSGKSAPWSDQYASLLEMAEDIGVPMESGCRAGNCGTCILAIKSGRVAHPAEVEQRVESGMCLACVAVPDGDVEVDA